MLGEGYLSRRAEAFGNRSCEAAFLFFQWNKEL
jgi:hypothetical protein